MSNDQLNEGLELSTAESWDLLREAVVGRLAVMSDDRPDIFPVNHLVDHESVVFRTAAGSKLQHPPGTGWRSRLTAMTWLRPVPGASC